MTDLAASELVRPLVQFITDSGRRPRAAGARRLEGVRMNAVEFIAAGTPRLVSSAIEACANEQRLVSALVVPWESLPDALSMAVTSARVDGWAIEHTNLGTIRLTDIGNDRTRVAIATDEPSAHDPDRHEESAVASSGAGSDRAKLARLFDAFAHQIQKRFQVGP